MKRQLFLLLLALEAGAVWMDFSMLSYNGALYICYRWLPWLHLNSVCHCEAQGITVQCFYVSVCTVDIAVMLVKNSAGGLARPASPAFSWQLYNSQSSKHPAIHHPVWLSHTWLVATAHTKNQVWTLAVTTQLLAHKKMKTFYCG